MSTIDQVDIWRILESVSDPEIPALSVVDLGIVRAVEWEGEDLIVSITPTYSGCPAMALIEREIARAFAASGVKASVRRVLSPAWTTQGLSEKGRQKLHASGIAPPAHGSTNLEVAPPANVACPLCGSDDTEVVSAFGSTACKSLFRCRSCGSPFDYFKPL